jgi:hypothetical protein
MVGRGENMSRALTRKARRSETLDMDEWIESSTGSEMLDMGLSKRWLSAPLTFLLSLRSMPPELPAGRFWGIGSAMARISSSRMWSFSLRRLLDIRRTSESLAGSRRKDCGRCNLPRPLAAAAAAGRLAWEFDWKL